MREEALQHPDGARQLVEGAPAVSASISASTAAAGRKNLNRPPPLNMNLLANADTLRCLKVQFLRETFLGGLAGIKQGCRSQCYIMDVAQEVTVLLPYMYMCARCCVPISACMFLFACFLPACFYVYVSAHMSLCACFCMRVSASLSLCTLFSVPVSVCIFLRAHGTEIFHGYQGIKSMA